MNEKQVADGMLGWEIFLMENPNIKGMRKADALRGFTGALGIMAQIKKYKRQQFIKKLKFWRKNDQRS